MTMRDKILLQLYYPNFNRPASSRFESLFLILGKKEEKKPLSYKISPERIIRSEDKRTSILIKNIPKSFTKKDIRNLVERFANINFLRLIQDKKSKDFIKAYINVINYKSIVPIFMGLRKHVFNYNDHEIITEIYYSKFQGKEELKKVLKIKDK